MKELTEELAIKLVHKVAKVNQVTKTIKIPMDVNVGLSMWSNLDYLTNHCGYSIKYYNSNTKRYNTYERTITARESKKELKEHKLTNKRK